MGAPTRCPLPAARPHRARAGRGGCRPGLYGAGVHNPAIARPAEPRLPHRRDSAAAAAVGHHPPARTSPPRLAAPLTCRSRARARTMPSSMAFRRCRAGGQTWCARQPSGCAPSQAAAAGVNPSRLLPLAGCPLPSAGLTPPHLLAAIGGCACNPIGPARRQHQGCTVCGLRWAWRRRGGAVRCQSLGAWLLQLLLLGSGWSRELLAPWDSATAVIPSLGAVWRAQAGSWHRHQLGQWRPPPWFLCKLSNFLVGFACPNLHSQRLHASGTIRSALEPLPFPLTAPLPCAALNRLPHLLPPPCPSPPCARQAQELVCTEGYQANDMELALRQAYLRMDELLVKVRRGRCLQPAACRQAAASCLGCAAATLGAPCAASRQGAGCCG